MWLKTFQPTIWQYNKKWSEIETASQNHWPILIIYHDSLSFLCNYFMVALVNFLYLHLPDMLFYLINFHNYFQYILISTYSEKTKDRDGPSSHWGEVEVYLYPYAISALEMGWMVNTTSWALYPPGKRPGTHCTESWQWNLGDQILEL